MDKKGSPNSKKDLKIHTQEPPPGSTKGLNLDLSSMDKMKEIFDQVKSLQILSQKVFKNFEKTEETLDKQTQECFGKKQRIEKLIKSMNIFSPSHKQKHESVSEDIISNYNSLKEAIVISNVTLKQIEGVRTKLQLYDQMLYEINACYLDLFRTFKLDPGPQQKQFDYSYKGAVPTQNSPTFKGLLRPFMMGDENQYIMERNPIAETLMQENVKFQLAEQSANMPNLIYSLVKISDDLILNGPEVNVLNVLECKSFNIRTTLKHDYGHLFSGVVISSKAYLGMSKGLAEFDCDSLQLKRHYQTGGLLFSVQKINNTQLILGSMFKSQGILEMFMIKSFSVIQTAEVDSGIYQIQELNQNQEFGLATRRGLQVAAINNDGELQILEEKYCISSAVYSFVVMSEVYVAICISKGIVIANREKKRKVKQIGQYDQDIKGPIAMSAIPTVNPSQFALVRDFQGISLIDFGQERIKLLFRADYQDQQCLTQQMLVEKDDKDLVIVVIEFGGNNSKIVRRKLILDK